jgi:hypothetical protein
VGYRHAVGWAAFARGDIAEHVGDEPGGQLLRGVGLAPDQYGRGIADAALELAYHLVRVRQRAPLRRLSHQERTVLAAEHGRRHDAGLLAEGHGLRHAGSRPGHGGARVGGS